MLDKLVRTTGQVLLPPEWRDVPAVGIVNLAGECEVSTGSSLLPVVSCHMVVVATTRLDWTRCDRPPVLLFATSTLNTLALPREVPILLDEISIGILMDVFVDHHRPPEHRRAALDLACHQAANVESAEPAPTSSRSLADTVEDYLRGHLDEPLALKDLEAQFHCSSTHLNRHMRAAGKPSPMKLLSELRIAKARILLRQTDFTVSQIAVQVGIPDLPAFSHFFKKHTGLSPSAYRENINWLL
ncbi:MAG: AraC family transcriptional regulator [Candidatus Pacebacteria bacterium]|nr:AraC family transcriptional regulator [Candidatus Paceibacterota bacterium]